MPGVEPAIFTEFVAFPAGIFRNAGASRDGRVKPHKRQDKPPNRNFGVMTGLVPAIHVSRRRSTVRRGWPGQAQP
jgi:hypothetical protein